MRRIAAFFCSSFAQRVAMLLPLRGVACACCCVRVCSTCYNDKNKVAQSIVFRCIICPIHSFNHRFAISFACCCWSRDTTEHVRGVVSPVRVVACVYALHTITRNNKVAQSNVFGCIVCFMHSFVQRFRRFVCMLLLVTVGRWCWICACKWFEYCVCVTSIRNKS